MNKIKSFFSLILLCSAAMLSADCANVCSNDNAGIRSFILPRSQGSNTAMELVGWQEFIHQCDVDSFYGVADVRFEYSRTFKPERIAEQLFGASTLHFQGSAITGSARRNDALLADYFGLSTNFDGAICFKPRIDNFIVDFNFYLGLDQWLCGLYFEAHLPIVHTRWTLFDCDNNSCSGNGTTKTVSPGCGTSCAPIQTNGDTTPFLPGYMNSAAPTLPPTTLSTVPAAPTLITALGGTYKFGDMQTNWSGGMISACRLSKTRVADLELQFGWDFLKSDWYHLGVFLEVVCPTGGRPAFEDHVFGPIVGNGGHAEVGGGISGHIDLWSCDGHSFSAWVYGNVAHAFKKSQLRTFDFNAGPFSRYMLLKELDSTLNYTGNMINAVNYTTRTLETSIRVKGDASFKLAYNYCGFRFDLGYNIYGDSGERCARTQDCCQASGSAISIPGTPTSVRCCSLSSCDGLDVNRIFALKGCTGVGGEFYATNFPVNPTLIDSPTNQPAQDIAGPVRLNASASKSTAFSCSIPSGTGTSPLSPIDNSFDVAGIANPTALTSVPAVVDGLQISTPQSPGVVFAANSIANGVNAPVVVSLSDLNICSGLARSQITHKAFGYAGYNWMNSCYTPFIGFVWEVEFAQNSRKNNGNCATTTNNCSNKGCNFNNPVVDFTVAPVNNTTVNCGKATKYRGGVSQWGVGIKGGLTF